MKNRKHSASHPLPGIVADLTSDINRVMTWLVVIAMVAVGATGAGLAVGLFILVTRYFIQ